METTARPHRPRVRRALGPAGVALLFVLLAGLVGMHGLGGHGLSGHSSTRHATAGPVMGQAGSHSPAAGHVAGGASTHALAGAQPTGLLVESAAVMDAAAMPSDHVTGRSAAAGAPPGPVGGHGALGLCLAVLVASVLGLLAARLRTSRGWRVQRPLTPLLSTPVAAARRDRDPPSLAGLCLLRC